MTFASYTFLRMFVSGSATAFSGVGGRRGGGGGVGFGGVGFGGGVVLMLVPPPSLYFMAEKRK